MSAVAVDTMVLIWGLRSKSAPAGGELQRRAGILLSMLEEEKATVIVPSVVVAELLVPIPPAKHGEFIAELRNRFFCPPFDLQSASLAAELWQKHQKLAKKDQLSRATLKADVLIVAAARVGGASVFYSHERKCRNLAKLAAMDAHDLPTHHENIFLDHESRKTR